MESAFLLAKTKYQFANFKKTPPPVSPSTPAVLLDPFHAPITAKCFNDFFGPPTKDLSYLKVRSTGDSRSRGVVRTVCPYVPSVRA